MPEAGEDELLAATETFRRHVELVIELYERREQESIRVNVNLAVEFGFT